MNEATAIPIENEVPVAKHIGEAYTEFEYRLCENEIGLFDINRKSFNVPLNWKPLVSINFYKEGDPQDEE